jgi:hypothetical protein
MAPTISFAGGVRRIRVLVRGFLIPLIAIAVVVMAIVALPNAIRAASGEGTKGSFSAERQECLPRGGCAYYGTWTADPPEAAVVQNVLMDEWPTELPLGSTVPAVYLGQTDPAVVYPADGSIAWVHIVLTIAGAVLAAGIGIRAEVLEHRADRRAVGYRARRAAQPESQRAEPE